MSEKENLKDQLARRRRINRMKHGIVIVLVVWMLATAVGIVFLLYRVARLEHDINILATNRLNAGSQLAGTEEENLSAQTEIPMQTSLTLVSDEDNLAGEKDVHKVYLTFDDGPSANTDAILDVLDSYGVKATFFVIGKEDADYAESLQRIVSEGHTLGMHSYAHKYSEIYGSLEDFKADFEKESDYLYETTGERPTVYRFPGGSSNRVSNTDMSQFIRFLDENGITYFDWNVSGGDATSQAYSSDEIVDNVVKDVVKYKTSVVLLHDADDKDKTVEALGTLIEALQSMNAEILPIDEDTSVIHYAAVEN